MQIIGGGGWLGVYLLVCACLLMPFPTRPPHPLAPPLPGLTAHRLHLQRPMPCGCGGGVRAAATTTTATTRGRTAGRCLQWLWQAQRVVPRGWRGLRWAGRRRRQRPTPRQRRHRAQRANGSQQTSAEKIKAKPKQGGFKHTTIAACLLIGCCATRATYSACTHTHTHTHTRTQCIMSRPV